MSASPNSAPALLQRIAARAATDLEFRAGLLSTPERTIRDAFGTILPTHHIVRFVEKPAGVDTLIVLPDLAVPGDELDDDELDAVAGGTGAGCTESGTW